VLTSISREISPVLLEASYSLKTRKGGNIIGGAQLVTAALEHVLGTKSKAEASLAVLRG